MDLNEKNHQINMTSNHPISSNNSLNAQSFNMILTLWQLCETNAGSVSVARVTLIQLKGKTQKNPHHQKYQ